MASLCLLFMPGAPANRRGCPYYYAEAGGGSNIREIYRLGIATKATVPPVARMRRESGFQEGIRFLNEESQSGGHGLECRTRPASQHLETDEAPHSCERGAFFLRA